MATHPQKRTGKYWLKTSLDNSNVIDKLPATQRDHEAIVEAHVPLGPCPKSSEIFKRFLVKVLDKKPSEAATLCDYQIPHGRIEKEPGKIKVLHVLHWPNDPCPPSESARLGKAYPSGPAKFRFEAYTLKVVTDMFPDSEIDHCFTDYVPKHMKIKDKHGRRLTNDELYGDLPLDVFVELIYDLIIEGDFDVIIIHGGPARRALKKRLGLPNDLGNGQDYGITDYDIGDKKVSSPKVLPNK